MVSTQAFGNHYGDARYLLLTRDRSRFSAAPRVLHGIWSSRAVREIDVSSPKPGDQEYGHSFNQTKRSLLGLHYEETVSCGLPFASQAIPGMQRMPITRQREDLYISSCRP